MDDGQHGIKKSYAAFLLAELNSMSQRQKHGMMSKVDQKFMENASWSQKVHHDVKQYGKYVLTSKSLTQSHKVRHKVHHNVKNMSELLGGI